MTKNTFFFILLSMVVSISTVFSQVDKDYFTYKYKITQNHNSNTTISLGSENQKYNIQYKKNNESTWIDYSPSSGNFSSITIEQPSQTNDIYTIRYCLSNNSTPKALRIDFGDDADKLVDIMQWGARTTNIEFITSPAALTEPQRYILLQNISAEDIAVFKALSFRWNTVFTGTASHMNKWDLSAIKLFSNMFQGATNFNGDITQWDVSHVTKMSSMFMNTESFNQPIGNWDVSQVETFQNLFSNALAFDQDLSAWTPAAATNLINMFSNSNLSTVNYDNIINGWWAKKTQLNNNIELGVKNLVFNTSKNARQGFIDEKNWVFNGDIIDVNASLTDLRIDLSSELKQQIRLGIDAERLWHWRSSIKEELAHVGVVELQSNYVRVAINCSYELSEGVIDESAYDQILEVMTVIKDANPNIHFFASPRPFHESYNAAEKKAVWGHRDNVPFSPYPPWILQWNANGTKTMDDGTVVPRWERGYFDYVKLTQYFADYLNFIHTKGFTIRYMDVINEQTVMTPEITKYIYDNLPSLLNPGVSMPGLIAPSSWSIQQGINWIDKVNTSLNEDEAFEVLSVHNTGGAGSLEEFASKAQALGKEVWNTEMHQWMGLTLYDDIITSSVFFDHMRAGFNGIDTWRFYGQASGADHPMIWASSTSITKPGRYEIFKKIVNNANRGHFVNISQPSDLVTTSAFVKDSILSVWVLNKSDVASNNAIIDFGDWDVGNKEVQLTKWHESLPTTGVESSFVCPINKQIVTDLEGETLYFYKINIEKLNLGVDVSTNKAENYSIVVDNATQRIIIYDYSINEKLSRYTIFNIQGKEIETSKLAGSTTHSKERLKPGAYIVKIHNGYNAFVKKVIVHY